MELNEVRIHAKARFTKGTPLLWDFHSNGRLRLVRWTERRVQWMADRAPNAHAVENLPAGGIAILDIKGGIAEVKARHG
jgi:hypothetical protein